MLVILLLTLLISLTFNILTYLRNILWTKIANVNLIYSFNVGSGLGKKECRVQLAKYARIRSDPLIFDCRIRISYFFIDPDPSCYNKKIELFSS